MAIYLATPPVSRYLQKTHMKGKPLEIAVIIGPDPAVLMASVTWCPEGIDKLQIAGGLKGRPIEIAECEELNLTEFRRIANMSSKGSFALAILSGMVFLGGSGIYSEECGSPRVEVSVVSHRDQPLFQALQPWSSEDDALLNLCYGTDLFERVRSEFSFVQDLVLGSGTVGGHCILAVRECTRPMMFSAMASIFGRNFFVKRVVVVDDDIDIRNYKEVEWALATRFQADRDHIPYVRASGVSNRSFMFTRWFCFQDGDERNFS